MVGKAEKKQWLQVLDDAIIVNDTFLYAQLTIADVSLQAIWPSEHTNGAIMDTWVRDPVLFALVAAGYDFRFLYTMATRASLFSQ